VLDDVVFLPLHHQVLVWAMRENLDLPISPFNTPVFREARLKAVPGWWPGSGAGTRGERAHAAKAGFVHRLAQRITSIAMPRSSRDQERSAVSASAPKL
jgi:hypothetical protein